MTPRTADTTGSDRRLQILDAAMACFARKGFHAATMQDISESAGISVGLIYRYFDSKEQVIASMAETHLADLRRKLDEARGAPTLLDAVERVLWCDHDADIAASFVVDLFAEAGRSAHVRGLMRQIHAAVAEGVTQLIAISPESERLAEGVTPRDAAEMIVQAVHGRLLDEIVMGPRDPSAPADRSLQDGRSAALRRLWAVLLPSPARPAHR
jgi:TetR/AcrR family transcriptional repressor of uid operon